MVRWDRSLARLSRFLKTSRSGGEKKKLKLTVSSSDGESRSSNERRHSWRRIRLTCGKGLRNTLKRNRFFFLPSRKEKTENGQSVHATRRNNRVLLFNLHLFFFFFPPLHSPDARRDSFIASREAVCFSTIGRIEKLEINLDRLSSEGSVPEQNRSDSIPWTIPPTPLHPFPLPSVGCQIR